MGGGVEHGGVLELEFFFGDTVGLELAEFGEILFAVAAEAAFLELKVAQLFFVFEESIELGDAFLAAAFVERHFEDGDAEEPPIGVGEGLDEDGFAFGRGLEVLFVFFDVVLIAGGIVGGEQDGAAGEGGGYGVGRGAGFAFLGTRSGGEPGIGAIGGELDFGELDRLSGIEFGLLAGEFLGTALSGATDGAWSHGGSRVAGRRFPVMCAGGVRRLESERRKRLAACDWGRPGGWAWLFS